MTDTAKGAITTGDQRPEKPFLIRELAALINISISKPVWKRLRIALTREEVQAYKDFIRGEGRDRFVYALRGVPLLIEDNPDDALYVVEIFEAPPDRSAPSQTETLP